MNDTGVAILADSGKRAAVSVEGLEAKLIASMKAVRADNWLALDNEAQFRAALGGVLISLPEGEDKARLKTSISAIAKMNSFLQATSAGLTVELPDIPPGILPLIKMWADSKK